MWYYSRTQSDPPAQAKEAVMPLLNQLPPYVKEGLLRSRYLKLTNPKLDAPFRAALEEMPSQRLQHMVEEASATDAGLPIDFEPPASSEREALIEALLPLLEELDELVIQEAAKATRVKRAAKTA